MTNDNPWALPFFAGLKPEWLERLAGCATPRAYPADAYLFREGGAAAQCQVITQGHVALEIAAPGRPPVVFLTLGRGDVVGISWLAPPYRWSFDARAVEPTHTLAFDAVCLNEMFEADHEFGYVMMKRFLPVLVRRLQATRLQVLDVYARH
ncbi:MAG TPA: cyclic nucleotide-binding domain-containing protein [Acidocella sp.]|nr:cyclic nucleotide-binding domain-containing protein [Acidocella sp.]